MRREAIYLGHPRFAFPIRAKLWIQSIGSGCKFPMHTDTLRGWDLSVESSNLKHGFNPASLLEIWMLLLFLFGYAVSLDSSRILIRIIEIDGQNRDFLQNLIHQTTPLSQQDAG